MAGSGTNPHFSSRGNRQVGIDPAHMKLQFSDKLGRRTVETAERRCTSRNDMLSLNGNGMVIFPSPVLRTTFELYLRKSSVFGVAIYFSK